MSELEVREVQVLSSEACKRLYRSWLVNERSSCPVTSHGGWSLRKQMAGAVTEGTRQAPPSCSSPSSYRGTIHKTPQHRHDRRKNKEMAFWHPHTDWSMDRPCRAQHNQG